MLVVVDQPAEEEQLRRRAWRVPVAQEPRDRAARPDALEPVEPSQGVAAIVGVQAVEYGKLYAGVGQNLPGE